MLSRRRALPEPTPLFFVGGLLLAVAALVGFGVFREAQDLDRLRATGMHTGATVVDYRVHFGKSHPSDDVEFQFFQANGDPAWAWLEVSHHSNLPIGKKIELIYDPAKSSRVASADGRPTPNTARDLGVTLGLVGAVTIALGVYRLAQLRRAPSNR